MDRAGVKTAKMTQMQVTRPMSKSYRLSSESFNVCRNKIDFKSTTRTCARCSLPKFICAILARDSISSWSREPLCNSELTSQWIMVHLDSTTYSCLAASSRRVRSLHNWSWRLTRASKTLSRSTMVKTGSNKIVSSEPINWVNQTALTHTTYLVTRAHTCSKSLWLVSSCQLSRQVELLAEKRR